jgi:collagenase-like PrtC family protease
MKRPELLAPAGSLKSMRYAYAYGADAVYAGQPRYSMRVRNNEFVKDNALEIGIAESARDGQKIIRCRQYLAAQFQDGCFSGGYGFGHRPEA